MRKSLDVLDRRLSMSLTTKVKVAKYSFLNEKPYNKTVIDSISVDIIQLLTNEALDMM